MTLKPIGDIVTAVRQTNPTALGREWITYIDIAAIDRIEKRIGSPERVRADAAPSRARQVVATGDVLVSTVRPNLNAVAAVPSDYSGEIASTGFCVLRPRPECVSASYLYFFTRTRRFVSHLEDIAVGASYPAVTDGDVLDTFIPLPDLGPQLDIAATLEVADRLCRTRRHALQTTRGVLDELFRRRFAEYFLAGRTKPLGDLVTITGGGTPPRSRPEFFQGRVPWLTSKDVRGDYIWDTEEHISEEAIQSSATKLVPADSILVVVKSKVLMHRLPVAIAGVPLCHGQDIKSLQMKPGLHHEFARHVLRYHAPGLLYLARGANTEGLTLPMLEELPVPDVSWDEQLAFANVVDAHEALRTAQREALRQTVHLFDALLHHSYDLH